MLADQIEADYKVSMKEKNTLKVGVLRLLKSAIKNRAIEKKTSVITDDLVLEALNRQAKQHKNSIEEFSKADRDDLVQKEISELQILNAYLPQPLSQDELKGIVQKAISETGAKSKADMGKVMKHVMAEVKGRADGKTISDLAASLLPR